MFLTSKQFPLLHIVTLESIKLFCYLGIQMSSTHALCPAVVLIITKPVIMSNSFLSQVSLYNMTSTVMTMNLTNRLGKRREMRGEMIQVYP